MEALDYIKQLTETKELLSALARELSGTTVPEFSSEPLSVADTAKLIGIPESAVRAGILNGWLPIGKALANGKEVTNQSRGKTCFVIFPRKVWEVTGHVWKGKGAV